MFSFTSPNANCIDCCIVHSTSAGADPELVGDGGGCTCMLLLHPVLPCTDARTYFCAILSAGANTPLAHGVLVTSGNLYCMVLYYSATYSPFAHVVVSPSVTCTGGV